MTNLIPKALELLNLKELEVFKVKDSVYKYRINEKGNVECYDYVAKRWNISSRIDIASLLNGTHEIKKLPFKPKNGESYKYLKICWHSGKISSSTYIWNGFVIDFLNYNMGNCYPVDHEFTHEEKEEFKTKLIGKYNAE